MTRSEKACYKFQSPEAQDVCPFCKRPTEIDLSWCDGCVIETHRCREHGAVPPMRSQVMNESWYPA